MTLWNVGSTCFAQDDIKITYRAQGRPEIEQYAVAGDNVFIFKPNGWPSTWRVLVHATNSSQRDDIDVGFISVRGATDDDITLYVANSDGLPGLFNYGLRDCAGVKLDCPDAQHDANLTVVARLYRNLTGNIFADNSQYRPVKQVNVWCVGAIAANVSIEGTNIVQVRAHGIEGGVTIESLGGTGAQISQVTLGYNSSERQSVPTPPGGWPTMAQMNIGTSQNPVTLITPSGVDISGQVAALNDLFVDLDIGGHTAQLRNALIYNQDLGYSSGTLTHRMQVTGETVTLGGVFACSDSGGYLDTASEYFYITSSTSDYEAKIASLSDGMNGSYDEVDFRGRFWFNGGIAASACMRLSDDMDGELIFNAANNQRLWSALSNVRIDGVNVSGENPAYSHVTSGGGTIGMVDGVGNDLGFHLHPEACDPPSGSEISLAHWKSNGDPVTPIYLVFYGPIRLEGDGPHVDLQWFDPQNEEWVTGGTCAYSSLEVLLYDLLPSGTNTSLNVLKLRRCAICPCVTPLGEYRIIEKTDGVKSDLGLQDDPDVQPFTYYFTLVE